jgi:ketosteroid isomerase-like protein
MVEPVVLSQTEVAELMNTLAGAVSERDVNGIVALFAPNSEVVCFVAGTEEKRLELDEVRGQLERHLVQWQAVSLQWQWRLASAKASLACVSADGTLRIVTQGREEEMTFHLTVILEKSKIKWAVLQSRDSVPVDRAT